MNQQESTKKLTWNNIDNFFEAKQNKNLAQCEPDEQWRCDQAEWRLIQVEKNSPICISEGYCKDCKCEWDDGLHYEKKACESGCYPEWIERERWENLQEILRYLRTMGLRDVGLRHLKDSHTNIAYGLYQGSSHYYNIDMIDNLDDLLRSIARTTLTSLVRDNERLFPREEIIVRGTKQESYDLPGIIGETFKLKLDKKYFNNDRMV